MEDLDKVLELYGSINDLEIKENSKQVIQNVINTEFKDKLAQYFKRNLIFRGLKSTLKEMEWPNHKSLGKISEEIINKFIHICKKLNQAQSM